MTVGEALNRRSDLQKRIAQLQERLRTSVLVQEGDEPPESPEELLTELDSRCDDLQRLIAQINHTNASAKLPTGETVTAGLARRDVLALRQSGLRAAVRSATNDGLPRYSRSEIRMVRQISVSEIQGRVDGLAKEQRELDTLLQEHNWTTPLIESQAVGSREGRAPRPVARPKGHARGLETLTGGAGAALWGDPAPSAQQRATRTVHPASSTTGR